MNININNYLNITASSSYRNKSVEQKAGCKDTNIFVITSLFFQ